MKKKITYLLALAIAIAITNKSMAQDGANDPTFNPNDAGYANGADAPINKVIVQPDGKILLAGIFSRYKGHDAKFLTRINADETFDTGFTTQGDVNGDVTCVALQPDGKIIAAGYFTVFNGGYANRVVRLNADGSLDTTFNTCCGLPNGVTAIALQQDGKILLGAAYSITRLNADGTTDFSFNTGSGPDSFILDMAVQPDGKILVAGSFGSFNGTTANNIARLNSNGSVDAAFNTGTGSSSQLVAVAVAADGKIYVGGTMATFNGQVKHGLVRLNANGSIDAGFAMGVGIGGNAYVNDIVIQPDGKAIIVGRFTGYNLDSTVNDIIRVTTDGNLDSTFNSPVKQADLAITSAAVMPNGKIIIGGVFSKYNGISRNFTVMLNEDGNLDDNFTLGNGTGADNVIKTMLQLPDNKIFIAGDFNYYNGTARKKVAVINADGVVDTAFDTAGTGANGIINFSVLQSDGKIIVAGNFTTYNGIEQNKIARINANGSLDESYDTSLAGIFGTIQSIALQPDGKAIIGGPSQPLSRINVNGDPDGTFAIPSSLNNVYPQKIIVLSNGKILVGCGDASIAGGIIRLNTTGTPDTTFNAPLVGLSTVRDIALDAAGNIFVCGFTAGYQMVLAKFNANGVQDTTVNLDPTFPSFSSITHLLVQDDGKIIVYGTGLMGIGEGISNVFARLNANGTIDTTFTTGTGVYGYTADINKVLLQPDGKLIVAGGFLGYNNTGRNRIARVLSSGALDTKTPVFVNNTVIAYKEGNALQIKSANKSIATVSVYDITGRLLAYKTNVNDVSASLGAISSDNKILIVNVGLDDNSTVSKKIYY